MPKSWDHIREQELLLAIHATNPSFDWAAVAAKMGDGTTANAIKKHLLYMKQQQTKGGLKAVGDKQRASPTKASKPAVNKRAKKVEKVEKVEDPVKVEKVERVLYPVEVESPDEDSDTDVKYESED